MSLWKKGLRFGWITLDARSFTDYDMGALSRIQQLDPINGDLWDEQVSSSPGVSCFHGTGWARVLHHTYGHIPTYLGVLDGKLPRALLPLMEVDSPLTGRRGVSLPFADECNLLVSDGVSGDAIFQEALELGRRRRWKYLEIRGVNLEGWTDAPSVSYVGHRVDLSGGENSIYAGFEASVRRAIRKAEKSGVKIRITTSLDAMEGYYELHCRTRHKLGAPPQSRAFFRNLFEHVIGKGTGVIAEATYQDRPIAGAVFLHTGSEVTYKFGGSDERFLNLRGNNLMMWEAMKWHASKGYLSLTFGRTAKNNEGLHRYKCGYGAKVYPINYYRYDFSRKAFRTVRDDTPDWINMVFRLMPMPVFRTVGTILYRHLS